MVALLAEHDPRLAIENHPERSAAGMLAKMSDGAEGRIGTVLDTG